jgi:hypothetical protein
MEEIIGSIPIRSTNQPLEYQQVTDTARPPPTSSRVPALDICGESYTIEVGLDVATLGFPMGEIPLMPYDQSKAS